MYEEQRRLKEPPTALIDERTRRRTAGERDRDRILYSSAFQRLAGVTQVMPAGAGQAAHSRLTHSLKVAQVSRRISQRLLEHHPDLSPELDPDAAEAAALAHDLGHPPFGHIAEEVLDKFATAHDTDGFEGNAQSFRIVTRLTQRWPASIDRNGRRIEYGLNLTRRTLDGLLKYPWFRDTHDAKKGKKWGAYGTDRETFNWVRKRRNADERSLGAQIMDWADDLTYAVHDMEDFYRAGLVPLDRLCTSDRERERFHGACLAAKTSNRRLKDLDDQQITQAIDGIFELLDFVDPYTGTAYQRQILRERSSLLIRRYMHALELSAPTSGALAIDPVPLAEVAVLKELTWFYVIDRPDLASVQAGQRRVIKGLCKGFWDAVKAGEDFILPPLEQNALRSCHTNADLARLICDFISRLTEARAIELYQRLLGTSVPALPPPAH